MSVLKKIPREDKKYLDPEARRGDSAIALGSGRVYRCVESANEFLFAGWQRVTPWRNPATYFRIRFLQEGVR